MEYPQGFPGHLKPPVEQAIAEAEIRYLASCKKFEGGDRYETELPTLIYDFIKKIFFAFTKQAREAGREGLWSIEKIRLAADEYLHHLIGDVFFQKDPSPTSSKLTWFKDEATSKLLASEGWMRHQRGLAALARSGTASINAERASAPMTKDFILKMLDEKGWSIGDWASKANVAYHIAADYLEGKKNPYKSTRAKLANALGIPVNSLPIL
jgi:lambda repressor-like predicted transcriptional regulator